MNVAAYLAIEIDQGATFELDFALQDNDGNPIPLSGGSATGQLRTKPETVVPTITFTGTITDGPNGKAKVSLTPVQTATIPVNNSGGPARQLTSYCYDIDVTYADGTIQRVLEGICYVSPSVAR